MRIVLRQVWSRQYQCADLRLRCSKAGCSRKKVLDRSLFDVVHLVELVPQADGVLVKAKTEWK